MLICLKISNPVAYYDIHIITNILITFFLKQSILYKYLDSGRPLYYIVKHYVFTLKIKLKYSQITRYNLVGA